MIWGHPPQSSDPDPVRIPGSTWGGSMLKLSFVERDTWLEFRDPQHRTILTALIVDIRTSDQVVDTC